MLCNFEKKINRISVILIKMEELETNKTSAKDLGILSNSGMLVHKVGEKKHNYF